VNSVNTGMSQCRDVVCNITTLRRYSLHSGHALIRYGGPSLWRTLAMEGRSRWATVVGLCSGRTK